MKKLNGQNLLLAGLLLLVLLFPTACTCGSKINTTTSTTATSMTTESSSTFTTTSITTSTNSIGMSTALTITTDTQSSTSAISTTTESTTTVQQIINGMIDSQAKIKSYSFESNTRISIEGSEAGTGIIIMTMVFSGVMDLENKELKAVSTYLDSTTKENGEMSEGYIVDGMMYSNTMEPGMEPVWEIEEFSEAAWEAITWMIAPFESYLELLETAEVSAIGSEQINGVDCYVLELTPDVKDLWQTTGELSTELGELGAETLTIIYENTDFSVKQWVAKDTYFLTRSEIKMSIKGIPGTELENGMTYNMIFYAYDQNKPFSIEVPPEALAAATTVP